MRKIALFIGRFQPYHNGHHKIVTDALEQYDDVLVILGSGNAPISTKNPFFPLEREMMVEQSIPFYAIKHGRVAIWHIIDFPHDHVKWASQVIQIVDKYDGHKEVDILGSNKDAGKSGLVTSSDFYSEYLPRYEFKPTEPSGISATDIRESLYTLGPLSIVDKVPSGSYNVIERAYSSLQFQSLRDDFLKQREQNDIAN